MSKETGGKILGWIATTGEPAAWQIKLHPQCVCVCSIAHNCLKCFLLSNVGNAEKCTRHNVKGAKRRVYADKKWPCLNDTTVITRKHALIKMLPNIPISLLIESSHGQLKVHSPDQNFASRPRSSSFPITQSWSRANIRIFEILYARFLCDDKTCALFAPMCLIRDWQGKLEITNRHRKAPALIRYTHNASLLLQGGSKTSHERP